MKVVKRLALFFVLAVVFVATQAHAKNLQTDLVVDQAGIFGEKIGLVEKSAMHLNGQGADVHVWTIKSFEGSNSLDEFAGKLEKDFPAWRSAKGNRKSNLILLIISMKEKKMALYYGGEWTPVLKRDYKRIQSDIMRPRLARGEYADGFVAGLDEISRLVDEYLHPKRVETAPVVVVQPPPSTQQTVAVQPVAPRQPADTNGLLRVIGWLFGGVIFFAAAFVAFRFASSRRKEEEDRKKAQQAAKIVKNAVTLKLAEVKKKLAEIDPLLGPVVNVIAIEAAESLLEKAQKLKARYEENSAAYASVCSSAGDPDNDKLARPQYEAINEAFSVISNDLNAIVADAQRIVAEVNGHRDEILNAKKSVDELDGLLTRAEEAIRKEKSAGYRVESAERSLRSGEKSVKDAKQALSDRKMSDLLAAIGQARKCLDVAVKQASSSRVSAEEIRMGQLALDHEVGEAKALVEAVRRDLEKSVSTVGDEAGSLRDGLAKAEIDLASADSSVKAAQMKAHIDTQDWDGAKQEMAQASKGCRSVVISVQAIADRLNRISEAKAYCAEKTVKAESLFEEVSSYLVTEAGDISSHFADGMELARKSIDQAKSFLALKVPDYQKARAELEEAFDALNRIHQRAISEVEAKQSLRQQQINQFRSRLSQARAVPVRDNATIMQLADMEERLRHAERSADTSTLLTGMVLLDSILDHHESEVAERGYGHRHRHGQSQDYADGGDRGYGRSVEPEEERSDGGGGDFSFAEPEESRGGGSGSFATEPEESGGGGSSSFDTDSGESGGGGSDDEN